MRTADISGMDPSRKQFGYEWGCQVIMFRALRWLRERSEGSEFPRIRSFKNIIGVTQPANKAAQDMESFALNHPKLKEFGVTGAMVQYSIAHAMKRAELGETAYFAEFSETPDRIYDFDESDAFREDW